MYASEQGILNAQWNAAELACRTEDERQRPFVLLKPSMKLDGNKWCALYGENLMEGVAAFGSSPDEASRLFDEEWLKQV